MRIENDVLVLGGARVDTIVYVPELPLALADSYLIDKPIVTRAGQTGDFLSHGLTALGLRTHHLDLIGDDHPGELTRALHRDSGIALTALAAPSGTKRAVNLVIMDKVVDVPLQIRLAQTFEQEEYRRRISLSLSTLAEKNSPALNHEDLAQALVLTELAGADDLGEEWSKIVWSSSETRFLAESRFVEVFSRLTEIDADRVGERLISTTARQASSERIVALALALRGSSFGPVRLEGTYLKQMLKRLLAEASARPDVYEISRVFRESGERDLAKMLRPSRK